MKNPSTPLRLQVKRSKAGLGLYTLDPIPKDTLVVEYVGPYLTNEEADAKCGKYLFEVSKTKTIDGSSRKNTARYINHSCRPNCDAEVKKERVYIVSRRAIRAGEELSYDYGKEYWSNFIKPYGCRCEKCTQKKTSR